MSLNLKSKTVSIDGNDSLSGGAPSVNWLLDHGAKVSIIGRRDDEKMELLAKKVDEHIKRVAKDGKAYEKLRARLVWTTDSSVQATDLSAIFFAICKKKVIGISGKYGKTTTALWAAHLIDDAFVVGHAPDRPLLSALDSRARVIIMETRSSLPSGVKAVIVSTDGKTNEQAAMEAARQAGVTEKVIQARLKSLPQVPLRQEIVRQTSKLTVVNDAAAKLPGSGLVAVERFGGPGCVLIAGGAGEDLDYSAWADTVRTCLRQNDVVLLEGSATRRMRVALGSWGRGIRAYPSLSKAVSAALVRSKFYTKATLLFSPAAKSYELFNDEFDRGRQFNELIDSAQ